MSGEVTTIIINAALLLVAAVSAGVAIVQAVAAARSKAAADAARDAAVTAQKDSAAALNEANAIAREAKDALARNEARVTERHSVRWEAAWETASGQWRFYNRGVDAAIEVVLYVWSSHSGRHEPERAARVEPGDHLVLEFEPYRGQGGWPEVRWEIEWMTALGSPQSVRGHNESRLPPIPA